MRGLIILLCLVATGLSVWLTVQKLNGSIDSLAGCGKGSGCENVLGSKWSVVFGSIPVSLFSSFIYLGVIISLFIHSSAIRWFRIFAAFLMLGAAVWFTALQLFVMKTICPYCMAMHSLGTVVALLILITELKRSRTLSMYVPACVAAIACVMTLAAIQHFGPEPDTHRVDADVNLAEKKSGSDTHPHTRGEGRLVSFFDGKKSYRVSTLPHLGKVDATHVIIKYFDYTCASCKDVHGDLEKIQAKYPGQLTVIVLPVPLNRGCNPHLPIGVKDHMNACNFARIALKVWLADPEKFAEFHHWMFQYHQQPVEVAEAMAYSLVGDTQMNAVSDDEVERLLKQNVNDYKELVKKTPVMPKLILNGKNSVVLQGVTRDAATLENLFKQYLGLGKE
jgi:uncharacterized membrane protein/protein-disulfide isomerase